MLTSRGRGPDAAQVVASWDVAGDLPPLDVRAVFAKERGELVRFLSTLTPEDWRAGTVCDGWSVHDIALHLLGNDFLRLQSRGEPSPAAQAGDQEFLALAAQIEAENEAWVRSARRIAPGILVELLAYTGPRVDKFFATVDLDAPGVAVGWTGSGPSPYWLDIAREYTERWIHHAQLRVAVDRRPLLEPRWLHPVLDAFMRSLPRAYEHVSAPVGIRVAVVVTGDAGGRWVVERFPERWRLTATAGPSVDAAVEMPPEAAWRLLSRTGSPEDARASVRVSGDTELGAAALGAVAIMTTRL